MRALAMLNFWQIKNAILLIVRDRRRQTLLVFLAVVMLAIRLAVRWRHVQNLFVSVDAAHVLQPWVGQIEVGVFVCLVLLAAAELDRACMLAVLEFSPADIDYLFPAPCPRRMLLAAKLPVAFAYVAMITACMCIGFRMIWAPLALTIAHSPNAGVHAIAAVAFCMGGYANLAIGVELFCIGSIGMIVRRCLLLASAVSFAWFAYGFINAGVPGLVAAAHNGVVEAVYYPCKLCAEAAMNPFMGRPNGAQAAQLAIFFVVSLGLLFVRGANYYEAAMAASELVRSRRVEAGGVSVSQSPGRTRTSGRIFTIPPFGRRAAAILWAHLAVAAKQPFVNFVLPFAGGLFVAALSNAKQIPFEFHDRVLVLACFEFFFLIPTAVSQVSFQQSVRRHSMMRVLPFPAWRIVLAEVLPRAFMISPCFFGVCAGLLALHHPHALLYVPFLLIVMPLEIVCMDLRMYAVVLAFPGLNDKFQALQAGSLAFLLMPLILSVQGVFAIIPDVNGAPDALFPWTLCIGCIVTGALLFSFTTRLYTAYQPATDVPKNRVQHRESSLPTVDEALAFACVFPWLALYIGLWLHEHPEINSEAFFPYLLRHDIGYLLVPALLFVFVRRLPWRETLALRTVGLGKLVGAALLGMGLVPWLMFERIVQNRVWPMSLTDESVAFEWNLNALAHYPIEASLAIGIIAGLAKEPVYRGLIQTALQRRFSERHALLIGAAVYAVAQIDARGIPGNILIGIVLGWLVIRTGSVLPAVVAHAVASALTCSYNAWQLRTFGVSQLYWLSGHDQGLHGLGLAMVIAAGALLATAGLNLIRGTEAPSAAQKNIPASAN